MYYCQPIRSQKSTSTIFRSFLIIIAVGLIAGKVSAYDVHLNVPFKSQVPPGNWKGNPATLNCGQTSALMVFSFYKRTAPTEQGIKDIDDWLFQRYGDSIRSYSGSITSTTKLITLAKEYGGFNDSSTYSNWSLDQLRNELNAGYPVIIAVYTNMIVKKDNKHFMVLIGMDDNYIYVNDPGHTEGGNKRYSIVQFQNAWMDQGSNVAVIHPNPLSTTPTGCTFRPDSGTHFSAIDYSTPNVFSINQSGASQLFQITVYAVDELCNFGFAGDVSGSSPDFHRIGVRFNGPGNFDFWDFTDNSQLGGHQTAPMGSKGYLVNILQSTDPTNQSVFSQSFIVR